jgi:DNA-directed RNA polymerase subunit RPC12/RpoP
MIKCARCEGKYKAITWNYYAYGKDKNGNQQYICSYCKDEFGRAVYEALIESIKEARNK